MENHPIPQDVTGFKFKLIGSITVKQFLYLLGFGILTTVAFILNINLFIKIPLMLVFASVGVALAFIPIEGRPMDIMIINFARAIPAENRYVYRKRGVVLASFEFFGMPTKHGPQDPRIEENQTKSQQDEKRNIILSKLRGSSFKPDLDEEKFFNKIKSSFADSATSVQKLPDKMPERNIEKIKVELAEAKKNQEQSQADENLVLKIKQLEQELTEAQGQKDKLTKKVIEYETANIKRGEKTGSAHFIPQNATLVAGFPVLPDVPNIVMGIVRDPRGKTLQNIMVEVVDTNETPVRAFKTNALGQFASATTLKNGIYKIYFEDPGKKHEFETIEVNLTGDIFNPLEIKSIDAREKLRRELFGQAAPA